MPGAYFSQTIGAAYGKIVTGTKTITTAGTAEQFTATSTPIGGVWLAADSGNTGGIAVVGDSAVVAAESSQQGIILTPGNQSIFLPINNLNLLYGDVITNGDKITYAYLQPLAVAA